MVALEAVTAEMLYQDSVEELENSMNRRQTLLNQLSAQDTQIREQCAGAEPLLRAINHQANRGELSQELGQIYDASLAVKAVASRVSQADAAIVEHIELQRDALKTRIEEVNSGGYAVAKHYYKAAQTGGNRIPKRGKDRTI